MNFIQFIYILIIIISVLFFLKIGLPLSRYLLYAGLVYLFILEPLYRYYKKKWIK